MGDLSGFLQQVRCRNPLRLLEGEELTFSCDLTKATYQSRIAIWPFLAKLIDSPRIRAAS
jgi:hypothetical protein